MNECVVLAPHHLRKDGKKHPPGSVVELDDEAFIKLAASGVVAPLDPPIIEDIKPVDEKKGKIYPKPKNEIEELKLEVK
jgi:hypothetical protein